MEITGIPAASLSLSLSHLHEEVGGIVSGTMISDSKSNLGCITFPPSFLLPPPFLGLTDLVSSGTSLRIDKRGNRFSSRFASKKKKKEQGRKREYLLLRARWTKSFSSSNEDIFFSFFFNEYLECQFGWDDNSLEPYISTYLSGPICKFN